MPVVRPPSPLTAEVGTDPPGSEEHGPLEHVLVFLGLGDGTESPVLVGDGTNELAVAVPACLADVDMVAQLQRFPALRVEPLLALGRILGGMSVGGREAIRKPAGEVLELEPQVAIVSEQLLDCLLG